MASVAEVLAKVDAARSHIDAVSRSYPRDPGDASASTHFASVSVPTDLASACSRVRAEQTALAERVEGARFPPRDLNYYVAPDGSLRDAAHVPDPPPSRPLNPPRVAKSRVAHAVGDLARTSCGRAYPAEVDALAWLRECVLPLLAPERDPRAVFGTASRRFVALPRERAETGTLREPSGERREEPPSSSSRTSSESPSESEASAFAPPSVGANVALADATGAPIVRIHLNARLVPSATGRGDDREYDLNPSRFGAEAWTFANARPVVDEPGPCAVLFLGADGEYRSGANPEGVSRRRAWRAWLCLKEDVARLHETHKPWTTARLGDPACKWAPHAVPRRDAPEFGVDVAGPLAAALEELYRSAVASRGASLSFGASRCSGRDDGNAETFFPGPGPPPAPRYATAAAAAAAKKNPAGKGKRAGFGSAAARREALRSALGAWTVLPGPDDPHRSLGGERHSLSTLRLAYDLNARFAIHVRRGTVVAEKHWDVVTLDLTRDGKPKARGAANALRVDDRGPFDAVWIDCPGASRDPGCFLIPARDLVRNRHAMGALGEDGRTLAGESRGGEGKGAPRFACDERLVGPRLRLQVPRLRSRWRGERAPYDAKEGEFVDPIGAWAREYFVAFPEDENDVARAELEARRILLGDAPSWDGEWVHPMFRQKV